MSRMLRRSLLVAALAGGGVAMAAAPASADPCVGTQNIGVVCVGRRTLVNDCVYVGSPPCTPVNLTAPVCVYGGGTTWELWTIGCSL
jgi:hypothetical protein